MSLFSRILGIAGSVFQVGGPSGPTMTASGTRLTASGNVAASAPAAVNDSMTFGTGAYAYNIIASLVTIVVPSGGTFMQAGPLDIEGTLDLSSGDILWVY